MKKQAKKQEVKKVQLPAHLVALAAKMEANGFFVDVTPKGYGPA